MRAVAFFLPFLISVLGACGSDDRSTGATCPTANPPTYESFGKAFFDTNCIGCHSSARTGAMRGGAPVGRDYDTLAGIRKDLALIDETTASGPDATNTVMPPGLGAPTTEQRATLGQFLACEKAK